MMFDNDHLIKEQALRMWANFIETNDVSLSAEDVKVRNNAYGNKNKNDHSIRVLHAQQINLVARIRELAKDEMKLSSSLGLELEKDLKLNKTNLPAILTGRPLKL